MPLKSVQNYEKKIILPNVLRTFFMPDSIFLRFNMFTLHTCRAQTALPKKTTKDLQMSKNYCTFALPNCETP